jgi:hypothetical protein
MPATAKPAKPAPAKRPAPQLDFVTRVDQRVLDYLAIILFGPSGVGKTTAAWSAPEPVLVLTTEPDRRTRFARHLHVDRGGRDIREVLVRSRQQLEEGYLYARDSENGIQSVVIDTVAGGYRLALEHEMGTPKGKPTLPNHGDATAWLDRHLRAWLELPINVVLVCHELVIQEGESTERYPMISTNQPTLSQKIGGAVDVAAYCGVIPSEDGSGQSYVAQVVPGGGRHVKDGTGVLANGTEPIPTDLSAWCKFFRLAYKKPEAQQTQEVAA